MNLNTKMQKRAYNNQRLKKVQGEINITKCTGEVREQRIQANIN